MAERQAALDGGPASQAEAGDVASLVDRLTARFGRETVQRFVTRDTHDPVRAGGSVPFLSRHKTAPFAHPEPGQPPARPLTLFDPPQWIEALAEVPDGPPLRFRWRRVLHEVARAEGPERIAPEWWRCGNAAPATRDYYRIENAHGHRFWVFREGLYEDQTTRPRWFLHGLFA
jgi:protein ImuB